MLSGLLEWLAFNRQDAGIVGYLFVTCIFAGLALYKEWLVLGKPYHKECEDNKDKSAKLEVANEKLVEQRIMNERATAVIDSLKSENADLKVRLARAEGNQPWSQPAQRKRRQP